ncbi:MAG: hypothetical protein QG555_1721 [Thermodesulfobacteriota bacterium]|nr:hypothetical protein [Thermodesulfobacteriota bacterium]
MNLDITKKLASTDKVWEHLTPGMGIFLGTTNENPETGNNLVR